MPALRQVSAVAVDKVGIEAQCHRCPSNHLGNFALISPTSSGIHKAIVVFYAKHGHLLALQCSGKIALQLSLVNAFHADDHIRPFDEIGGKRCFGVVIGSGG